MPDLRRMKRLSGPQIAAAGAAVLAIVIRLVFQLTAAGGLDGDEAVTGIMARRIASGQDRFVYFLGQSYDSAIEQYPQAVLFRLGLPVNLTVLRIPQLLIAGACALLVYAIGVRMFRTRWHAVLASLLFAIGPYFSIWKGARSWGSYGTAMLVCLVGVLLVLQLAEATDLRARLVRSLALGGCFGLMYSFTATGYYVLIPVGLWLFVLVWRDPRCLGACVVGLVVGLAPAIYWWLSTGEIPKPTPGYEPTTAMERFSNLFDEIGREFIGVAMLGGAPGWPVWLGRVVLWALVGAGVVGLARRWRGLVSLALLRSTDLRPFDLVLMTIPVTVAVYVASKFAWFTTEPRYLFVLFPIYSLGLVGLVPAGRRLGAAVAVVLVLFIGGTAGVLLVTRVDDAHAGRPEDFASAISTLEHEGRTKVYADYWTAMPLEFWAHDRLTVGTLSETSRLLDERRTVDRDPAPVWVAAQGVNSDDITQMRRALDKAGVRYRERRHGDVSIFDEMSPAVRPWEIGLGTGPP